MSLLGCARESATTAQRHKSRQECRLGAHDCVRHDGGPPRHALFAGAIQRLLQPATVFLLLLAGGGCARGQSIDWPKVHAETLEHFTALLRIDTTNPPGNETRAARYVQSILEREGIPARLFALEPDRANMVARIRGNGSRRPILIMAHTDVVGVQRSRWSVDPFAGIRKDGYIWGRGATDDKDNVAAGLMVMLLLKRTGIQLSRDVIFLAEAGEEAASRVGIDFMINRHWNEIEAEFAIAEGGYAGARRGQVRYVAVTTTEKIPRGVRLIARGTAGHGSRPIPDNAVARIAQAVARVSAWQPPIRLNDTTRTYFERLATVSPPEQARRYNHILNPARIAEIDRYFWQHEPGHYSILRTSITPTIINAGFRTNVIPSEAEAYLDVRTLPDEDLPKLLEQIRSVIADDRIEVRSAGSGGRPPAPPSRIDTAMFSAFERAQQKLFPGAITLPAMLTGATDMAQVRAKGVQAYGIGPTVELTDTTPGGGAHGDDERLAISALETFTRFLWEAVLDVAR